MKNIITTDSSPLMPAKSVDAKEKARKCDELEANYGDDKSVESKCRSSFDIDAAVLNNDCATAHGKFISRTTTETPRSLSVALNGSQCYELCNRARAVHRTRRRGGLRVRGFGFENSPMKL